MLTLEDLALVFAREGARQYTGEQVTQLEHALQTAHLAEQSGADDTLVAACLLHDLGHMLQAERAEVDHTPTLRGRMDDTPTLRGRMDDTPTLRGVDDLHQYAALPWLRGLVSDAVLAPIRLHVDAKRYLCHASPAYHARLSEDSQRSLVLQGGVYDAAAASAFIAQPHAREAVLLRQWDDLAKQPRLPTPPLAHFLDGALRRVVLPAAVAG